MATALKASLEQDFGLDVVMVDPFRTTNRHLAHANEKLFEWTTASAPWLYGLSYYWTRNYSTNHVLWKLLAKLSRRAAWRALVEYSPDIVVQLFPDHALASLPAGVSPLISVVLTDYAVHSRWFHSAVDLYVFPTAAAELDSRRFRSLRAAAHVAGIPIREQFSVQEPHSVEANRSIVISAGGRGVFPDLADVVRIALSHFPEHRVIVLCGRNDAMRSRVSALSASLESGNRVEAIGFTHDVARYFRRATLVIGKAGGVSTAECMACGTPVIFYKPLPGQELENARCIQQEGAGRVVRTIQELSNTLAAWSPSVDEQMRGCAKMLARPHAAREAAGAIVGAWQRRNASRGDDQGSRQ
ncbi:MGDG synthase family glycosyltransferase [Alicyclobacillus acidiphilus]|uniref:MGDG synthase family glycosyltransferase n=1 Tax=Alicyclobacillus acidiphilus TaxID=182455 RepID=UPI001FDF9744|nr:glycosyltransferase [Alicyclobacillus acidiphilus]